MNIILTKENSFFLKKFQKLDPQEQVFLKKKLKKIFLSEEAPQIKKLSNYQYAEYRLRIGSYRLLFQYNEKTEKALFLIIKHRKDLY